MFSNINIKKAVISVISYSLSHKLKVEKRGGKSEKFEGVLKELKHEFVRVF